MTRDRAGTPDTGHVAGLPGPPNTVADRAFRALADNVRDYAIFLMNPDGVITFWGEGARLMKWWTRAQAEGSHLRLLYPDGGSEDGTAEEHLLSAAETGEYTGEGSRIRSDGSVFWAGITLTALKDEAGTLHGFAKVTRDLTARRAADAVLQSAREAAEQSRRAAEAANRAKSGFLATMSHEIRTPLNAIIGYLELLEMESGVTMTDRQREYIARLRRSSRHLHGLVDDVLDLSRLEANQLSVARSTGRVGAVLEAALTLIEPQAQARQLRITDSISGDAANLAYLGDEERVRQIIVNLLSNAVKFTEPGGRVTVSAGAAAQASPDAQLSGSGPWVYVRVEDTGHGIAPDRVHAVFEPFVQADMTLTRQHGGSGLGLAISRQLARLMGGDITVRSEPGVGSAFFLWLAASPGDSRVPGAGPNQTGSGGGGSRDYRPAALRSVGPVPGGGGAPRRAADAALADLERILHAYVARLRSDPATVSAHSLDEDQLEDHLATFLADVAQGLAVGNGPDGGDEASAELLADGSAIQTLIAERHGRQRGKLGWSEAEVRREFEILGEEIGAAIRRHAARDGSDAEVAGALEMLGHFLRRAERTSLESLRARVGGE